MEDIDFDDAVEDIERKLVDITLRLASLERPLVLDNQTSEASEIYRPNTRMFTRLFPTLPGESSAC